MLKLLVALNWFKPYWRWIVLARSLSFAICYHFFCKSYPMHKKWPQLSILLC